MHTEDEERGFAVPYIIDGDSAGVLAGRQEAESAASGQFTGTRFIEQTILPPDDGVIVRHHSELLLTKITFFQEKMQKSVRAFTHK